MGEKAMNKGVKTGTIVAIVCWSIVALLLITVLTASLTGGIGGFGNWAGGFGIGVIDFGGGEYSVQGKYEVDAKGIDDINIQWTAGRVNVEPYDGDTIRFEEGARRELEDKFKLIYEVNGATLNIKYLGSVFSWNVPSKQLEMKVPKELAGKLSKFTVDSTSADVTVTSINAKTGRLHNVSGETLAQNSGFETLRLESTSGDINTSGVTAGTVNGSSVSGNMDLKGSLGSVDTSTTSGEIFASSDRLTYFKGNSVSGDIRVESDTCPKNAEFNTTSGGARLIIPENSGFTATFSSVSGDLHCGFPVITNGNDSVYKDGSAKIRMSTVSGDGSISLN